MQHADVDEIVRLDDGSENPIGKPYSKQQYIHLASAHCEVEEIFYHFFAARALHRFLDRRAGFMIYARLKQRNTAGF